MSYLSRVCVAASVAVIEGSTGHSSQMNSGFQPLDAVKQRHFSSINLPNDGLHVQGSNEENRRKEAEESLQRVMYLNCWAQS